MATSTPTTIAGSSRAFFIAFLEQLGIQPTEGSINALYAVEHLEGDNSRFNPLNVIQPEPGSHAFNSVGVQSYADFNSGVKGSATLFSNSHWTDVRAALRTGNTAAVLAAFQRAYTWDPSVHFPLTQSIIDQEANRLVGSTTGNPSGVTLTGGGGAGHAITSGILPGPLDPFGLFPGDNNLLGNPVTDAVSGVGGAVASGIGSVLTSLAKPLFKFLLNAFLVVAGVAIIVLAVVLLAHDSEDHVAEDGEQTAASRGEGRTVDGEEHKVEEAAAVE